MRLEPRAQPALWRYVMAPMQAISLTLVLCVPLILWAGAPVGRAYYLLFSGAFSSGFALSETLLKATPLIFTGLSVAVAFRARLYNIGAEGQFYLGALAAILVGGQFAGGAMNLPAPVLLATSLAASALAGGVFLLGPAVLKFWFGVDEVVTTLLLNFVALLFVSMMLDGPMKDSLAMGWPQSVAIRPELELVRLIPGFRVHTGLLLGCGLALVLWWIQRKTVFGLAMCAVGANAKAARFAGISVTRTGLWTALLSGGLAGLAGYVEVAGRTGYVTLDMSPGYGYSGIVIAMLAGLNPLGVVAAALFLAGIYVGADSMSRVLDVPVYLADVIAALALLSMLASNTLVRYRLRWN